MRDAKFIPCLHKGKIITREMGRVGEEHVWPIDSIGNATRTSYQSRDMILFDERRKKPLYVYTKLYMTTLFG